MGGIGGYDRRVTKMAQPKLDQLAQVVDGGFRAGGSCASSAHSKRDPKDDPVLAAALGARATYLVSYDRDLLDLGKPFGIQCVSPRAFLIALVSARC